MLEFKDVHLSQKIRKREETRYGNIYLKDSTQEPEAKTLKSEYEYSLGYTK